MVQRAGDYSIYRKRSGRYAVRSEAKKWVNGEEKTKILLEAGLIKVSEPRPTPPDEPAETAAGDASGEGEGDEQATS